ncbi:hypothetical protein NKR23_g11813 [Pleurostoma richardsiae]|uniref:Zn(2)-C6 fungal-type domain-containing protein n=1 Tax=Pleurostoma richardsiae TaxID=41990 RepID=A0AA38R2Z2_9PEZI|nr:hypothetical protein NKR23_g11813 [Pleurostoma richardsiae]
MARGPKSRSGCARCKRQRLKCDEAKPACGRCVRVGSPCPGPVQTLRWSNKHEVFPAEGHNTRVRKPASSSSLVRDGGSTVTAITPPSSTPETELADHDVPLPDEPALPGHSPSLDNEYTQPNGSIDFAGAEWSSQLFGNIFPGFIDAFNDPLATAASPADASHPDAFQVGTATFSSSDNLLSLLDGESQPAAPLPTAALSQASRRHSHSDKAVTAAQARRNRDTRRRHCSQHLFAPINRGPKDNATMLVEFYFRGAAQAYSIYDSEMNPFRSTVSRLWDSSRVIYLSLQSMAAACLVEIYPYLASLGSQLRKEALYLLTSQEREGNFDDRALLALLMLGGTSSWHDTQDMGVTLFNSFRKHVECMRSSGKLMEGSNSLRFFQESLLYWEMLLAYVVDDEKLDKSGSRVAAAEGGLSGDETNLQNEMMRASKLEAALLDLELPTESEIVSPEDRETPVWHLLNLAEVYRRVGLLQLYRAFPDVLRSRLESECNSSSPLDPLEDGAAGGEDGAGGRNSELSRSFCDEWLTDFALRTIDLLQPVPIVSGTRDFQPFLLVACSSELSYRGRKAVPQDVCAKGTDMPISMQVIEVSRARGLILSRLQAFLHCLPPKPIRRCIDIVQATWEKMDEQSEADGREIDEPIYWMDVMIERGWETTMG